MDSNAKKLKTTRSVNFSVNEKLKIVDLVERYKNFAGNKETDALLIKAKEKVWECIASEFNADATAFRSAQVLKTAGKL